LTIREELIICERGRLAAAVFRKGPGVTTGKGTFYIQKLANLQFYELGTGREELTGPVGAILSFGRGGGF